MFQHRFADPGERWRTLALLEFLIFVIPSPILVAVSLALRSVAAPPLAKFIVAGSIACVVCYGVAGPLLRAPVVRRNF